MGGAAQTSRLRVLRSIRIHRLCTALIAAFAFVVSSFEVVLPELHDGDASVAASTVTQTATQDLGAIQGSHAENGGSHHSQPSPDGALPHHGLHVDHCGHCHGATTTQARADFTSAVASSVPLARILALASVDLPLHQRPPIA